MEICKRCEGTGHSGGCDVCGGSGFIDLIAHGREAAQTKQSHAALIAEYRKKIESWPAPRVSPHPSKPRQRKLYPADMGPQDRICGLSREQLEVPEGFAGFNVSKFIKQIKEIVSAMPNVKKIVWPHSRYECTAHDEAGNEMLFAFSPPKTPNHGTTKLVATPSPLPEVGKMVSNHPKSRPRTIPHSSQIARDLSGGGPKKSRAPVGKGVLVRVVKAESSQKASQNPRKKPIGSRRGERKPQVETRPERRKDEKGRNEGPTTFELAFAAAKAVEIDGSKDWAGYRDVSTGRYGSYPSFDPSETPDE